TQHSTEVRSHQIAGCKSVRRTGSTSAYLSLEALDICTVDASGEKNLAGMAKLYSGRGKRTFAICDKRDGDNEAKIKAEVELVL
ncbi:hypothetical protein J8I87_32500, partial [Paraburkholderia sp. LEh10]|nr:hypothetical protein [Paraburkholderia sp. LEh10]